VARQHLYALAQRRAGKTKRQTQTVRGSAQPKKPYTAFFLFLRQHRAQAGEMKVVDSARQAGEQWRAMSEADKAVSCAALHTPLSRGADTPRSTHSPSPRRPRSCASSTCGTWRRTSGTPRRSPERRRVAQSLPLLLLPVCFASTTTTYPLSI
jgi:hypothetical protein